MRSRKGQEHDRLEATAEAFLRQTPPPRVPERLREFGALRIMTRAAGERRTEGHGLALPARAALRRSGVVLLSLLLLLAAGTSGVYAASSSALPGTAFYGSKIFFERARLALTLSRSEDARLEMSFCSRRLDELEEMVVKGVTRGLERWEREYLRNLREADRLLAALPPQESDRLAEGFQAQLEEQMRRMEACMRVPSDPYFPFVENVYRECNAWRTRIRQRHGEGKDGGCAPSPVPGYQNGRDAQPLMNGEPLPQSSGPWTTRQEDQDMGTDKGDCWRNGGHWED